VGGGFALGGAQAKGQRHRRRGARGDVALKPVAMQIDDPGQHQIAGQIDLGQGGVGQHALGQTDGLGDKPGVAKNRGAGQAQGGKRHRHVLPRALKRPALGRHSPLGLYRPRDVLPCFW